MYTERATFIFSIVFLVSAQLAITSTFPINAQLEMAPTQVFENQEQYVKIAFSADGKHIAAMSNTTDKLSVFNRTNMLWTTSVPGIRSIAITENASLIAAAAITGLYLFNTQNPAPQLHYELNSSDPLIELSNDGKTIAYATTLTNRLGTASTTLYLFETQNHELTWQTTLQGVLKSLSISDNGNYTAITTNQPSALHLFSKQKSTPLWTYDLGEQSGAAKVSNDGNYIIATGGNLTSEHGLRVYRFSRQSSQPNYIKIVSELSPTPRLSVSSQGSIFSLSFAQSSRLIYFNLNLPPYGYGPKSVLNISLPCKPTSVAISSDGEHTAVGTQAGIYVYEYTNKELNLKKRYTNGSPFVADIAITPSGWFLAAAATKQNDHHTTIYIFDVLETRNEDTNSWLHITILTTVILAASVYILYRKHKPQKPVKAN